MLFCRLVLLVVVVVVLLVVVVVVVPVAMGACAWSVVVVVVGFDGVPMAWKKPRFQRDRRGGPFDEAGIDGAPQADVSTHGASIKARVCCPCLFLP